jgi:hypothetical protein
MDYLYENLGDERFQAFCSNLIAKEFSNLQVFPVGQLDGGRDSLVYSMNSPQKNFIVFQVKFVRNQKSLSTPHRWITEVIKGEIGKIKKLDTVRNRLKYRREGEGILRETSAYIR